MILSLVFGIANCINYLGTWILRDMSIYIYIYIHTGSLFIFYDHFGVQGVRVGSRVLC